MQGVVSGDESLQTDMCIEPWETMHLKIAQSKAFTLLTALELLQSLCKNDSQAGMISCSCSSLLPPDSLVLYTSGSYNAARYMHVLCNRLPYRTLYCVGNACVHICFMCFMRA